MQSFIWHPENLEFLIEKALSICTSDGPVVLQGPQLEGTEEFRPHVEEVFKDIGYKPEGKWVTYFSVLREQESADGWCKDFPHTHNFKGRTVVHYLQEPELGGELVVYPDTSKEVMFEPVRGESVVIADLDEHGVREIHGDRARVAMIMVAYLK